MVSKGFLLFSCVLATVTGSIIWSHDPSTLYPEVATEEQIHPEELNEIATTVAGVILRQTPNTDLGLLRQISKCKLEYVSVQNFKHHSFHKMEIVPFSLEMDQITTETHHKFDATFKWTQCGSLNGMRSTCKNMRVVQSIDMIYTPVHEDEVVCTL